MAHQDLFDILFDPAAGRMPPVDRRRAVGHDLAVAADDQRLELVVPRSSPSSMASDLEVIGPQQLGGEAQIRGWHVSEQDGIVMRTACGWHRR